MSACLRAREPEPRANEVALALWPGMIAATRAANFTSRTLAVSRTAIPPAHLITLSLIAAATLVFNGQIYSRDSLQQFSGGSTLHVADHIAGTLIGNETPSTSFPKSTIHRDSSTTLLHLFADDRKHQQLQLRDSETSYTLLVSRRQFRLDYSSRERNTTS